MRKKIVIPRYPIDAYLEQIRTLDHQFLDGKISKAEYERKRKALVRKYFPTSKRK